MRNWMDTRFRRERNSREKTYYIATMYLVQGSKTQAEMRKDPKKGSSRSSEDHPPSPVIAQGSLL